MTERKEKESMRKEGKLRKGVMGLEDGKEKDSMREEFRVRQKEEDSWDVGR